MTVVSLAGRAHLDQAVAARPWLADWPQLFGQFTTPTEQDQTRAPQLRALLQVEAPVPLGDLPPPRWPGRRRRRGGASGGARAGPGTQRPSRADDRATRRRGSGGLLTPRISR
ncbi:hypothetical protein NKG94_08050 [Micromonospora sp. M12]